LKRKRTFQIQEFLINSIFCSIESIEAIIEVAIKSTELFEFKPGTLTCLTASTSIVSKITWEKDDITVDTRQYGIVIDDTERTLSFRNLSRLNDNGKYVCNIRMKNSGQIMRSEPLHLKIKSISKLFIFLFFYFLTFSFRYLNFYEKLQKCLCLFVKS
jgi:hypothetical protein